jgi:polyhydroxybutyrate depolymerase
MRALPLLLFLIACGESSDGPRTKTFGGQRPADLETPDMLVEGKQYPLVVVLHGFGANGFAQYAYFHLSSLVTSGQVLAIAPDGTTNSGGMQFWNADPACCDFGGQNPDDVGYLGGLIEDVIAEWPVDPDQVYVIGHSNGGYMAYRMACERADLIAGIVSLAGNAASIASSCAPSQAVSVLHLHGTLDDAVPYTGGSGVGGVGAVASVTQWATHDGCGSTRAPTVTLDLDTLVVGSETHGEATAGCPPGTAVDLWTLEGSGHIPIFDATIATTLLDWLTAHGR